MTHPINLTPKEAAERLRTTVAVMSNMRIRGNGPKFIKIGTKVLYPLAQIEAYEKAALRGSTAV